MRRASVFLSAMVWFAIVPGVRGATEPRTPACGEVIREDTILAADLTCARRGLEIGSDGITLDCDGHTIDVGTQFGDTVVAMYGRRGVTIQNCVLSNSYTGIVAFDSPDLLIRDVVLRDHLDAGVVASSCPRLRIEDSEFSGNAWQARMWDCPDAIIRGNSFVGAQWGSRIVPSDVDCTLCPRLRFEDNVSLTGVYLTLRSLADDGVIARNVLLGSSEIRVSRSVGCRVIDNEIGSAVDRPRGLSRIAFAGVSAGEIRGNRIMQPKSSDSAIYLVPAVEGYEGGGPTQYSNGNSVRDNRIESGFSGIHLQNASANLLAGNTIETSTFGVLVEAWPDPEPRPTGNRLELNDIRDVGYGIWLTDDSDTVVWRSDLDVTTFGIGALNSRRLRVEESRIRGASVGVFDYRSSLPAEESPATGSNRYLGNEIANSGAFGMIVQGGSPEILGNVFRDNGTDEAPPEVLEWIAPLFEDERGGIFVVPYSGSGEFLEDGIPTNDILAAPIIGREGGENEFDDSGTVAVFALDTRPANASSLVRDNLFPPEGGATRFRQDWFGLVRVEDSNLEPVPLLDVRVRDKTGVVVLESSTNDDGVAPPDIDTLRPQGLRSWEQGGPISPWPRFTEYDIDGKGQRVDRTPHHVVVGAGRVRGHAKYGWDGISNEPGSSAIDGRYQEAVIPVREP